jgi:hypothetical protein
MFTVKMIKYGCSKNGDGSGSMAPTHMESIVLRQTESVSLNCDDLGNQILGVQNPKTGEIERFAIGSADRKDVVFNVAYVMNELGKTIETVR